ncbi:MAG: RNA polymerase sigma factor [Planctomycetota bacterium]|nr:RNA polymerase sigma factor [Planctomycetota bacterium]
MADPSKTRPTISDAQLLQRHIEGDNEAFVSLLERFRRELFNFLARFIGDAALAEDVFQETFLQLHVSAGAFDPRRRLKPWLFTIAANKARDALRARRRRQAAPLDAEMPGSESQHASYASLIPANIPKPDEHLLNLETRQAVQNIVGKLPPNLHAVLVLSYFHGFAYKEIAEILNVPLGTVKSRLHSAVGLFARKWKAAAERLGHE